MSLNLVVILWCSDFNTSFGFSMAEFHIPVVLLSKFSTYPAIVWSQSHYIPSNSRIDPVACTMGGGEGRGSGPPLLSIIWGKWALLSVIRGKWVIRPHLTLVIKVIQGNWKPCLPFQCAVHTSAPLNKLQGPSSLHLCIIDLVKNLKAGSRVSV